MTNNNPNQPREDDVVLGDHAPPLVDGVVLGGIEGVKMRFASAALQQRVAALSEALKYGEAGLDLVIQGLQDESKQVKFAAYSLLKERLREYLPWFEFDVVTVDAGGQEINRNRRKAQFFEEDLGNGVALAMVAIPGGTFMMGSPETNMGGHINNNSPQHQVTVAPFFMGKYPITQVQWQAVAALPQVSSSLNPEPSKFKGENQPVERVSWHDASEFCARLSKKTGWKYRLPSEAEWEYACRAGTTTPYHFGKTITPELANFKGKEWKYEYHDYPEPPHDCGELIFGVLEDLNGYELEHRTTPVGHFNVANAFGLYDMHGNVWEWCADHWHCNYKGAPTDGSTWSDNQSERFLLLRGGSWFDYPDYCCSAYRHFFSMEDPYHNLRTYYSSKHGRSDDTLDNFGFRVACAAAWTS